ncbi:MAG TPA: class I SAM-dependent methyltransferase [Acidobacteriaceae bacterium]|nr:class I SAM-dependent methyltransferase [Acidobacteriaceae bacterium]
MSTAPAPSIEQIKANMRSAWMAGDFGVVAKTITAGAEKFIQSLDIPPGARVLDVACGTGNTAIPLARRGCIVTGVDIATNLLEQARARAAAEHLAITFDEGDAEALPYGDATFDAVTSMFGAMFAPRPELVASECARVLKPEGLLAMGNWGPGAFVARMFKIGSTHVPPPPGVKPPILWGDDATVRERLSPYFTNIETKAMPVDFDMPTNAAGCVDFFRTYFGPTKVAFSKLDESGQKALFADLKKLWSSENVAPDPDDHTLIRHEYIRVTARRK